MKQDQFDNLSRALADGVSRREFLKLVALSLASTMLESLGACRRIDNGGGAGVSTTPACKQGGESCTNDEQCCSKDCSDNVCVPCKNPGRKGLKEECYSNEDCCSGQCVGIGAPPYTCVRWCGDTCHYVGGWLGDPKICSQGPAYCYTGEDICCNHGYWSCPDPHKCEKCSAEGDLVSRCKPGIETCCGGVCVQLNCEECIEDRIVPCQCCRNGKCDTPNKCEKCEGGHIVPRTIGDPNPCDPGQECCGGECQVKGPCDECKSGKLVQNPGSEVCGGKCYERCKNGKPRPEANNCECEKCAPCPPNKIPVGPESCDCKCATIETCKDNKHFFSRDTCKCECKERPTCGVNRVWNEEKCACECPQITCPGGQGLNLLCDCDCPAGKTWCASQGKCVDNCSTPGIALDPKDCQCKDTFGCRANGLDNDLACDCECLKCEKGQCIERPCPSGLACCNCKCIDLKHDNSNCGGCGYQCACSVCDDGTCHEPEDSKCEVCTNGVVKSTCDSTKGETCCNGVCCPNGYQCCPSNPFDTASAKQCTDVSSNVNFCGSCNQPNHLCSWDEICEDGRCHSCNADNCEEKGYNKDQGKWVCETCVPGLTCCNRKCVRLSNDAANCGSCGTTCEVACCNGVCRDIRFDDQNCGACYDPADPTTKCLSGYYCCNRKCIPMTEKCQ